MCIKAIVKFVVRYKYPQFSKLTYKIKLNKAGSANYITA